MEAKNVDEFPKTQIRYLPAPEGFHAGQVQILDADHIVFPGQGAGGLVMKLPSPVGDLPMQSRQGQSGLMTPAALFHFSGQPPVRFFEPLDFRFQWLGHLDRRFVGAAEKSLQPEIEARSSTCRGSFRRGFVRFDGKDDPEVAHGIPGDRHGLDRPVDVAAGVVAIGRPADSHLAGRKEFPPGLFQRKGAVLDIFAERQRPDLPGRLLFFPQAARLEEQFIAPLDPFDHVLNRLGAQSFPFRAEVVAEIGDPGFEPFLVQMLPVAAVVPFVQDDTVVPYLPGDAPLPIQTPVPVGVIVTVRQKSPPLS